MRFSHLTKNLALSSVLLTSFLAINNQALAANNNDVNGFAILGGLTKFNGHVNDYIDALGGDTDAIAISGSYTWRSGFGLGLSSSTWADTGYNEIQGFSTNLGHANFYASYTFDPQIKLMLGTGALVEDTPLETIVNYGVMFGIGYTLPFGLTMEVHHSMVEHFNHDSGATNILIGYKW